MPRGKFLHHKGRNRNFTNPEELERQRKQDEEKRRRKVAEGGNSDDEEEEEKDAKGSGSDSDESSSGEEDHGKAKGVSGLIEVENPNRAVKKDKKLSTLNETIKNAAKPELSRREREELEKQQQANAYRRLHAAGATDEARADLARLALVRQQREEAARRREQEKQRKEPKPKQGIKE